MTLEDARGLVYQIVIELNRAGRPALGANIGWELSRRQVKDLQRQFDYEKLGDFIRDKCQPPLVVRQLPNSDIIVEIDPSAERPTLPVETQTPPQPIKRVEKVESRVWWAVLLNRTSDVFVHPSGQVASPTLPPGSDDNWKRVGRMPAEQQGLLLDRVRQMLDGCEVRNEEIRAAILAAAQSAKQTETPILELSKMVSPLYRFATMWHANRVETVHEYVSSSTGVDLRTVRELSGSRPPQWTPRTTASGPLAPRPAHAVERSADGDDMDGLRRLAKGAIDAMSLRELLDLRLPLESLRGLVKDNTRSRS